MVLSDVAIRQLVASGELKLTGVDLATQLGPCSVTLTVSSKSPVFDELGFAQPDAQVMLNRGDFVQMLTHEIVGLPANICAKITTRSSWARHGLMVHAASDMVAPGFHGRLQLEVSTLGSSVVLMPGQKVCELYFFLMEQASSRPYDGSFQLQGLSEKEGGRADRSSTIMPDMRKLVRDILPGR